MGSNVYDVVLKFYINFLGGLGGDFRKQEHLFVLKQYLELIEAKESSIVVHVIISCNPNRS